MASWSTIEASVKALSEGKFVIVVDDESREDEGDLILAAEFATAEACAFMVQNTNGILCAPITEEHAARLNLGPMVVNNEDRNGTAFTVTIDAAVGTTTGASADDRAYTIRRIADRTSTAADFNRPGHIFPLVARPGGTLERGGHTEASVDMCQLAGCEPVALICELMHPNGVMMRRPGCRAIAKKHNLEIITTAQIVEYRQKQQAGCIPAKAIVAPADAASLVLAAADKRFMEAAIAQGEKGRMSAPPNPWVGCVLVKDGEIIGRGFHHKAGEPHAEVMAMRDAEARAAGSVKGCTVYTTLEPCHHQGRTGPCDQALIDAGVARVAVSVLDPDEKVAGQGVAHIKAAGIAVVTAVAQAEGKAALREYLHHRNTGRPYTVLKAALSLDGKIACGDGSSQWITGEAARADGHVLRARSQAILVGSGTAATDAPSLTTRVVDEVYDALGVLPPSNASLRVVLDSTGATVAGSLLDTSSAPTLIFTSDAAPATVVEGWKAAGVQVCVVPAADAAAAGGSGLSLAAVLDELGARGILQLLVEGGSAVHASFLRSNLVDEIYMYKGATALGGSAKSWIAADLTATIADAKFWHLRSARVLGNDVCMEYELRGSKL